MMDLDQLEAFVSVATMGGFTKASRYLHRSQPAVSRRIGLLEKSLDVRLLERRGREIGLTPEGRVLLGYAQTALAVIQEGIAAVKGSDDESAGGLPIRIAIVGTLADQRLTAALNAFREGYPARDVSLRTATSREVSILVQRGEADVGIRYFHDTNHKLSCIPLGHEHLSLMAGADSPWSARVIRSGADLEGAHFLSFPTDSMVPDSFGMMLQRELLGLGIAEPSVSFIDSVTAQKRLVEAGYGVALLPLCACQDEIRSGTLQVLEVAAPQFRPSQPVVAVFRGAPLRQTVSRLVETLRNSFSLSEK